jgi:hypothetical protein
MKETTHQHIITTAASYNEFYVDTYTSVEDFEDKFEESIEDFESIEELLESFKGKADHYATVIRMHNEEGEAHFTFKDGEVAFDVYKA